MFVFCGVKLDELAEIRWAKLIKACTYALFKLEWMIEYNINNKQEGSQGRCSSGSNISAAEAKWGDNAFRRGWMTELDRHAHECSTWAWGAW